VLSATSTEVALSIDTASDGFEILEALALRADGGQRMNVRVTTATAKFLGITIGLIDYLGRLGVETLRLEEDLMLAGPRVAPQYLHLSDVQAIVGGSENTLPLHRVRIAEIHHCLARG
jgi:hypothetical protein